MGKFLWHDYVFIPFQVYKGVYKDSTVAVKVQPATQREAEKMCGLRHQNIITIHKVFNKAHLSFMVMDFMSRGSLIDYFRANFESLTVMHFIRFCHQICLGMVELVKHDIVHCDLRMNNILVAEDESIRIADFGLSRDADYYFRQDSMLNVRWSPPEAFQSTCKITSSYDVWSFGVLMWELFAFPARPFEEMKDVRLFGAFLEHGGRLSKPDRCPEEFYEIMMSCWHIEPDMRPTFQVLADTFQSMENVLQSSDQ